jgi:hypothetical protein
MFPPDLKAGLPCEEQGMDATGEDSVPAPFAQLTGAYWLHGPERRDDDECRWPEPVRAAPRQTNRGLLRPLAAGWGLLLLGRTGCTAEGLLVGVRIGGRVLDQVVAERGDVVADEL